MPSEPIVRVAAALGRTRLARGSVGALERVAPWRHGVVAIVTYHRVDQPSARPDLLPGLVSATPEAFEEQIDDLARCHVPVSMADIVDALADPRRLPPRAVHVTFDDAYRDFATHAWPVLRAAHVPVTLFVPTAFPDRAGPGFWWDRLWAAVSATGRDAIAIGQGGETLPLADPAGRIASMRRLQAELKSMPHEAALAEADRLIAELGASVAPDPGVLGWSDLRRLAAEGVTLAPHTRNHPLLDRVSLEAAVDEIAGSHADLEREVGPTPRVLAYPSGAHGGDAVEAARRAGMVLAVTTERGGNDLRHADPLRFRRINVGQRARSALVRGQLVWASLVDARRP